MRGYNGWNYDRFLPYDKIDAIRNPHICRIAPDKNSAAIELLVPGKYKITLCERGGGVKTEIDIENKTAVIGGLKENTDYVISASNGMGTSGERIFRTGEYPGSVVNYLHPADLSYDFSGRYLGSPSILKMPDGSLLASMDIFAGKAPQKLTQLFKSVNGGADWEFVTELNPCFWGKLFLHRGGLYMLSTSSEYGDLLIGRSSDNGKTWTPPTVIMRGSAGSSKSGFHKAPVRIISYEGKLVTTAEFGSWEENSFSNILLSIDEEADLLCADNWRLGKPLAHSSEWDRGAPAAGAIEGNVVIHNGNLYNILRFGEGRAVILQADRKLEGFRYIDTVSFPMGHSKFEIISSGDVIYAVGNTPPGRNVLSLYKSNDLRHWELAGNIIDYSGCDRTLFGFQYPSVCVDSGELLILSRTAVNGADSFHNSNCITFHRYRAGED